MMHHHNYIGKDIHVYNSSSFLKDETKSAGYRESALRIGAALATTRYI